MSDLYPQTHLSSESHINRTVRLTKWWHHWLDGHWVWASSGSWWTGKPGMLQTTGLQRVRHDWVTELSWQADPGREHLYTAARPLVLRCRSAEPHPHISMSPSVWGFNLLRYIWWGGPNQNKEALKTLQGPLKIHPEGRSRLAFVIRLRREPILKASP